MAKTRGGLSAPKLINETTDDRASAIIAVGRVLDEFRRLNPNMPVAQIQAFLLVALDNRLGMTEIADKVDVRPSTASRYLIDLGLPRQKDDGSYGLVERGFDSDNVRKARYHLTRKGEKLVKAILCVLNEEAE